MPVDQSHIENLFTKEKIIAYLQNKLSNDEKVLFEKQLEKDAFLQDALAGFQLMPVKDIHYFVDAIFKDIEIISGSRKAKPKFISLQTRPLAIAALLLIFVGISWFAVWFMNNSSSKQQIARAEKMQDESNVQVPSLLFDSSTVSESDVRINTEKNNDKITSPEKTIVISSSDIAQDEEKSIQVTSENVNSEIPVLRDVKESDKVSSKDDDVYADAPVENYDFTTTSGAAIETDEKNLSEVIVTEDKVKKDKLFKKESKDISTTKPEIESTRSLDSVYTIVDQMPQYTGGEIAMFKFIDENLKMPTNKEDFEGTIYVKFIVDETGKINSPEIINGLTDNVNKEVIRVISIMPNWIPGKVNGESVSVVYTLPIKIEIK